MANRVKLCRIFDGFCSLKLRNISYLDGEKEVEPVKVTGIIWSNDVQPPKILHRSKANEDEERLLGWHVNDDDNLLTVFCFSDSLS